MSAAAILLTEICPYCTHARSLHDIMPFAGTKICQECYQAHLEALRVFSDAKPPSECSGCHLSYAELCARAGIREDQQATMQVHYENGVYRILCKRCSDGYVRKRVELYGDTEFGRNLGLK